MRLHVYERAVVGRVGRPRRRRSCDGRAHFEYGQRIACPRVCELPPEVSVAARRFYALRRAPGRRPARRAGAVHNPARRVLAGPYESLNLGRLTDDRPDAVRQQSRQRSGAGWVRPAHIRQVHGPSCGRRDVGRPVRGPTDAGIELPEADGQATAHAWGGADGADRRLPAGVAVAGAPAAVARCCTPAGAVSPAGILAEGVRSAARARRRRPARGRDRAGRRRRAATRSARRSTQAFTDHATVVRRGRNLDLKAIARAPAAARGRGDGARRRAVHDLLGDRAVLLTSPRPRRHRAPGGSGVVELITGLRAEHVRANLERVRDGDRRHGTGPGTRCRSSRRSSTCRSGELGVLAEAGIELVGENRAQDLRRQGGGDPGAFTWDFIGHLQSRKVRQVLPHVRYIHSVASDSVLEQLGATARRRPRCWSRSTWPARRVRAGSSRTELPGFLERCPVTVVGLMTMPPLAQRPRGQPAVFRGSAGARRAARAAPAVDGDQPGLSGRRAGGCDDRATWHEPLR